MSVYLYTGTNNNAIEIKEVIVTSGESSQIPNSLVERDEYGNVNSYWVVDENDDFDIVKDAQYIVTKITSKTQHVLYVDSDGISSDTSIIKIIGEDFRLGFTGEKAIIEIKKVG